MKKVKVKIDVYSTYGGEDFPPGEHEVSEEAAKCFVEKKLGSIVGENSGTEQIVLLVDESELFEPKEAVEKYLEGDSSEKVFNSLKAHQSEILEFLKAEGERFKNSFGEPPQSLEEAQKELAAETIGDVKEVVESEKTEELVSANKTEEQPLPEDFPSVAKFNKLGFKTLGEVQKLTKENLVSLGISDATADKALSFGK